LLQQVLEVATAAVRHLRPGVDASEATIRVGLRLAMEVEAAGATADADGVPMFISDVANMVSLGVRRISADRGARRRIAAFARKMVSATEDVGTRMIVLSLLNDLMTRARDEEVAGETIGVLEACADAAELLLNEEASLVSDVAAELLEPAAARASLAELGRVLALCGRRSMARAYAKVAVVAVVRRVLAGGPSIHDSLPTTLPLLARGLAMQEQFEAELPCGQALVFLETLGPQPEPRSGVEDQALTLELALYVDEFTKPAPQVDAMTEIVELCARSAPDARPVLQAAALRPRRVGLRAAQGLASAVQARGPARSPKLGPGDFAEVGRRLAGGVAGGAPLEALLVAHIASEVLRLAAMVCGRWLPLPRERALSSLCELSGGVHDLCAAARSLEWP